MRHRLVAAGLGLLVALLLVGAAGPALGHIGDDATYRWVEPPSGVEPTGPAEGRTARLVASATELAPTEVWTPDLQVVIAVRATPLPPDPARRHVDLVIEPIAPSALPPPPSGEPDGNAYLITFEDPPRQPTSAQLLFRLPHEPTGLLYSADGARWEEIALEPTAIGTYSASFQGNGHYLAVESHRSGRSAAVTIVVIALPIATLILWALAARLGRRTPRSS